MRCTCGIKQVCSKGASISARRSECSWYIVKVEVVCKNKLQICFETAFALSTPCHTVARYREICLWFSLVLRIFFNALCYCCCCYFCAYINGFQHILCDLNSFKEIKKKKENGTVRFPLSIDNLQFEVCTLLGPAGVLRCLNNSIGVCMYILFANQLRGEKPFADNAVYKIILFCHTELGTWPQECAAANGVWEKIVLFSCICLHFSSIYSSIYRYIAYAHTHTLLPLSSTRYTHVLQRKVQQMCIVTCADAVNQRPCGQVSVICR